MAGTFGDPEVFIEGLKLAIGVIVEDANADARPDVPFTEVGGGQFNVMFHE